MIEIKNCLNEEINPFVDSLEKVVALHKLYLKVHRTVYLKLIQLNLKSLNHEITTSEFISLLRDLVKKYPLNDGVQISMTGVICRLYMHKKDLLNQALGSSIK